jgi:hypothetical protein
VETRFIEMQLCRQGTWVVEGVLIPRDTPAEQINAVAIELMTEQLRAQHKHFERYITYVGVYNVPQLTER